MPFGDISELNLRPPRAPHPERSDDQTQNPGLLMAERTAIEWTEPPSSLVGLPCAGFIRATVLGSSTIGTRFILEYGGGRWLQPVTWSSSKSKEISVLRNVVGPR
jgi:hypothetical protein